MGGFVRALWPAGPRRSDEEWARSLLTPPERACFAKMPGRDRREGVRTARRARDLLGPSVPDVVLAAALLHDVGKRESALGVYGRVVATLAGALAGPQWAVIWTTRRGFTRRVGLYLRHPEVGYTMLAVAGARPEVAAWASVHHDPARFEEAGFDPEVARALAVADGASPV